MGNVKIKHDASQNHHTSVHKEDNSTHHHDHVHYHGVPSAPTAPQPAAKETGHISVNIKIAIKRIVLGAGVLGSAAWLLNRQSQTQTQSQPIAINIHNSPVNTVTAGNTGTTTVVSPTVPALAPAIPPVAPTLPALTPPADTSTASFRPAQSAFGIVLDRSDRLYYGGDVQKVHITVPREGYLYVASVWADGQMRLLCHPDWLVPMPGKVKAGQIVEIPAVKMSYTPPHQDDAVTEEEVRAILSDQPIPSLPADRKADVNQAWRALGFPVQAPAIRYRGGELPAPETLTGAHGMLQQTAAYRMKRGARP